MATTFFPQFNLKQILLFLTVCGLFLFLSAVSFSQYDGFTEPFRTIELASDETGLIEQLMVDEGEAIEKDGAIARLSSDLQQVQFELASHLAQSNSGIIAAEQTLAKRQAIYDQLVDLRRKNHANENEVTRAALELDLAISKLQSANDEHVAREIEQRRALKQLEKRTIAAPFAGVISKIHHKEGEYLSPLRPEIVTLVEIDRLYATFNIPSSEVSNLKIGDIHTLDMGNGRTIKAEVNSIGVQTDAESGTVRIKLLIDNSDRNLRSGEACIWNL
jgi:RND family efflux transporter MFP subunit